jgi:hypothetical protein
LEQPQHPNYRVLEGEVLLASGHHCSLHLKKFNKS